MKKPLSISEFSRLGGKARWANLTHEQRVIGLAKARATRKANMLARKAAEAKANRKKST
jgi:hypothetical protein